MPYPDLNVLCIEKQKQEFGFREKRTGGGQAGRLDRKEKRNWSSKTARSSNGSEEWHIQYSI